MDFTLPEKLITALHARLSGASAIKAHLGDPARLYDHLPEDPVFPYLTYGAMRSEDIGADVTPLSTHALNLHIWSRYSGRVEVVESLKALGETLTVSPLSLDDAQVVSANIIYTDVFRAPDARTLHGILRVSFTIETELEVTS